jgi:PAS domain S-box-containing protein
MVIDLDDANAIVSADIRQRAEAIIDGSYSVEKLTENETVQAIIHELRVHQIELSIQNEEMRQTQLTLERAQSRYFELYHFAPVGYLTLDLHGVVLELNLAVSEMLGRDYKLVLGRPFVAYLMPKSHQAFFSHLQHVLHTKEAQSCELFFRRQDEAIVFIQMRSVVAQDEAGDYTICRSALFDITSRKKTEDNLLRYVGILKKLPLIICAMQLEQADNPQSLRIIWLNEAAERVVSHTERDVVGHLFYEIFPPWMRFPQLYAEVALAGKAAVPIEVHCFDNEHEQLNYYLLRIFPLPNQSVTIVFEDITAHKHAEQHLQHENSQLKIQLERFIAEAEHFKHWLDESLDGFMLAYYETLYVSYANRTVSELLGYDYLAHELLGQPYKKLWPEHDLELTEILMGGLHSSWYGKIRQCHKDGRVFEMFATFALVLDGHGQPSKLGITLHVATHAPILVS